MTWICQFDFGAEDDLDKLPSDVRRRILEKLKFFVNSSDPLFFAERLTNNELGMYRFRVGDYRIIFDVDGRKITVVAVGHRKEIYR